jgi:hypothetical protein
VQKTSPFSWQCFHFIWASGVKAFSLLFLLTALPEVHWIHLCYIISEHFDFPTCSKNVTWKLVCHLSSLIKIEGNLSLLLIKHHDMKVYVGMKVQFSTFLKLALDGGEWSALFFVFFLIAGWVDPNVSMEAEEKKKFLVPVRNWTMILWSCIRYFYFWVLHPVARIIKVSRSAFPCNNFSKMFILLPLHVSTPAGHLQAEYATISGSYFTYNGSVVLYY